MTEDEIRSEEEVAAWCRRKWSGTNDWLKRFGSGQRNASGHKWPQTEIDRKKEDLKMYARIANAAKDRIKELKNHDG